MSADRTCRGLIHHVDRTWPGSKSPRAALPGGTGHSPGLSSLDRGSPACENWDIPFLKKKSSLAPHFTHIRKRNRSFVTKHFGRQNKTVSSFCSHVLVRARREPGTWWSVAQRPARTDRKWPGCSIPGSQQEALPGSPRQDSPAASMGRAGPSILLVS